MYSYEKLKIMYSYFIPHSFIEEKHFICGSLSKLLSTVATYPLTTIRTRVQQNQYIINEHKKKYTGSWDICSRIIRDEGIQGFFKGLKANLIRSIPHRGVYFYFYEFFKKCFILPPSTTL
jgi:hypothetical protein